MLISENYRRLNRQMHEERPDYGMFECTGKWMPHINHYADAIKAASILDYGCGKGALGMSMSDRLVIGYDPAIPGKDTPPDPHDFVVCTDVLEHIEPDCLDEVLDDLTRLTLKGIFMTISTKPAIKHLSDGRNAHLIVQPARWWLPKIMERFDVRLMQATPVEFGVFASPYDATEGAGQ